MRRLAESGATTHMLMAVSGHKTLSEVQRYTEEADKQELATEAMERLKNKQLANPAPKARKPRQKSA